MNTVTITARKWSGGWELWNEDDCWTQVRRLKNGVQQVRDYMDTVWEDVDHSDWEVIIVPASDKARNDVIAAREAAAAAQAAVNDAAAKSRRAVAALLAEGLSTTDAAALMGISKGRVSQLAKARKDPFALSSSRGNNDTH